MATASASVRASARAKPPPRRAPPDVDVGRRRALIGALAASVVGASDAAAPPLARANHSGAAPVDMRALTRAFEDAMAAGADYDAADAAWTRAIAIAPNNSAAWSNRGTKRLQAGRWRDARDDLERSVELSPDPDNPDPLTLNNLGNAEGALGRWDVAIAAYLEASKSREMESIALANLALAKFQIGDVDDALRVARTILRRDPEFWDIRAAATAFLWADGREDEAEAEWSKLCRSGRGFGAASSAEDARADGAAAYAARLFEQQMAQQAAVVSGVIDGDGSRRDGRDAGGGMDAAGRRRPTADDTPCAMYRNVGIVAPRWPPRCTAALDAFLKVRREGEAKDYDGEVKTYRFV